MPGSLLFYAGLALLPYAGFVGYLSSQVHVSRAAVWTVVLCNALWAVDSVLLVFTDWVSPTPLGYVFVIAQTLIVAAFAELQFTAMRRGVAAASIA